MTDIKNLINDSWSSLKEQFDLSTVPTDVVDEMTKQLYAKMMWSVIYLAWSPYVIENNKVDIAELESKEEKTEEEAKHLIEMTGNLEWVERDVKQNKTNVEYYLVMIENLKTLSK